MAEKLKSVNGWGVKKVGIYWSAHLETSNGKLFLGDFRSELDADKVGELVYEALKGIPFGALGEKFPIAQIG